MAAPETNEETSSARATLRYLRASPQKVRLLVDLLRGKPVTEAMSILKFSSRPAARDLTKLLRSAVANAEQLDLGEMEDLVLSEAFVDGGPTHKRIRPAPMGRAYRYLHRTSHVTFQLRPLSAYGVSSEPARGAAKARARARGGKK